MHNVNRITGINFDKNYENIENSVSENEYLFFENNTSLTTDNFSTEGGWTNGLYQELNKLDVSSYTWAPLSNEADAIGKSQKHLMDLIRYYEGDPGNNYKAKSTYNDRNRVRTYGYGIVNCSQTVTNILSRNGVTLPPKNETEAYKAVIVYLREISAPELRNTLQKTEVDFDTLPNSIKEALLDLHFNKGLDKISKNRTLKNALKSQNWAAAIKEMVAVRAAANPNTDNPGLYRRSFSRIILAARDIPKTPELEAVLNDIYKKAIESVDSFNRTQTDSTKKVNKDSFIKAMDNIFNTYKAENASILHVPQNINQQNQTFKPLCETSLYSLALSVFPDSTKEVRVAFIQEVLRLNPDLMRENGRLDNDGWPICRKITSNESIIIPKKIIVNNQTISVNTGNLALASVNETEMELMTSAGTVDSPTSEDISNIEFMMSEFGADNISDCRIGANNYNLICRDFIYTVASGNTLWRIANSYNIDLKTLKQYNGLTSDTINVGQKIKIPKIIYEVKRGDTLYSVSRKLGLTIDVLKDLNSIDDVNKIKEGQTIEIPGYPYVVKRGDNLQKIADNSGVTLETLKALNGLRSHIIQPNQKLLIVFNNADYNDDRTMREVSNTRNYIAPVTGRSAVVYPYYRHHYENGVTVATKEVFTPTQAEGPLKGKRIIINAGHGFTSAGHDPGARHRLARYDESEITYLNAMALSDKLRAQGATVVFIQGGVNLASAAIAKETAADMMISLHVNSSTAREVANDRVEIYYNSRFCSKGKTLAEAIEKNIDINHPRNRHYADVYTANHAVTRARRNHIPSVLVELGFINNTAFRSSINNQPVRSEIVNAISKSVTNYRF